MPERVAVREDLQIIQIDSYGEVTARDMRESLQEVVRLHEKHGLDRVLIEASHETSLPSTVPLYGLGAELSASVGDVRFAIVACPKLRGDQAFLENVARNRGAKIRVFDSEEEAVAWLISEDEWDDDLLGLGGAHGPLTPQAGGG